MKIEVSVEDLTGKFILREHVGEGTYGDKELMVSHACGSPIIEYDGKYYRVSIQEIARAVCEAHEQR